MLVNYDVVVRLMDLFRDDYDLLFRCSLVNWEFNRAASRTLYRLVVISPVFQRVLNLKDTGSIPVS